MRLRRRITRLRRKARLTWANRRQLRNPSFRSIHRRARAIHEQDLTWVVVLTYARTGSTLVMGLLNSLDGFCIRGENDGAVLGLQTWDQAMRTRSKQFHHQWSSPTHPFWGIDEYPTGLAGAQMRELVLSTWLRPPAGTSHVGYKELRWPAGGLSEHIAFLRRLAPGVKIILNCRALDDVAQSAWYTGSDSERAWIASREKEIRDVASEDPRCYLLEYEKVTAGPDEMLKLADWLGVSADEARVRQALAVKHSVSQGNGWSSKKAQTPARDGH